MLINLRNELMTGGSKPAYWGLCFTAETAGATIALTRGTSAPAVSVETSFDGTTWTPYTIGTTITLAAIGDTVYFAAGAGGNTQFADSRANSHTNRFTMTGRIAAGGSIMSLLDRDNKNLRAFSADFVFCNLFDGCASLTAAPELPATQLSGTCYRFMFRGCTSLTAAPELPATTLANACYNDMFINCTSLTAAPELPATTLAQNCYVRMFEGCTSLTAAPELSATTLATACCDNMFTNCTSLTVAPKLPASTLVSTCYRGIFSNCANIRRIEVNFSNWGTTSGQETSYWVRGVASSGVFRCPAALPHSSADFGDNKIPPGWTVETF